MIDVSFEHWAYELPEELLVRYGSPHFDENSAGRALSLEAKRDVTRVTSHSMIFESSQILCGNEAFPEAAVADPIADLEVWDDWRSGIRAFPYPGRYGQLGIRRQEAKTSSPSSVGVLGEIMAGLFSQAGISPWIIVRVIRRWPDFIFYIEDTGRYAFVEAKAFTQESSGRSGLSVRIPDALLGECMVKAVHQINADPFVTVWGSFTDIVQVAPMRLLVTFLELNPPHSKLDIDSPRFLPQPVLVGLAERAISRAIQREDEDQIDILRRKSSRETADERKRVISRLARNAGEELESLLVDAGPKEAVLASRALVETEVTRMLKSATLPKRAEGSRFYSARERSSRGTLAHLRDVGAQSLLVADLSSQDHADISESWQSDWGTANTPWLTLKNLPIWRCGGSAFAIGERSFEGISTRQ